MSTPARTLRSTILKITRETPVADRRPPPPHYRSHRDHWLGWLQEYDGSGYYNRRVPKKPRSMAFIYAHIHCAPMLLWLAEAAGVRTSRLHEADRALRRLVQKGVPDASPRCGMAVGVVIPWKDVEAALIKSAHLIQGTRSKRASV